CGFEHGVVINRLLRGAVSDPKPATPEHLRVPDDGDRQPRCFRFRHQSGNLLFQVSKQGFPGSAVLGPGEELSPRRARGEGEKRKTKSGSTARCEKVLALHTMTPLSCLHMKT